MSFEDITGQRFGRLIIRNRVENSKFGHAQWLCECDCGNIIVAETGHLKSGHTQSCGCYKKERTIMCNTKHNKSDSRLYEIYHGIKKRCFNRNSVSYCYYGGRGISMCDDWLKSFQAFYDWAMENGYSDNLTIDRIDVNGNYEPSNCRWVDAIIQANNKRDNVFITVDGISMTIAEWSRRTGIDHRKISRKYKELRELLSVSVADLIEDGRGQVDGEQENK